MFKKNRKKSAKKSVEEVKEGMVNFICTLSIKITKEDWKAFKILCYRDNKTSQELAEMLLEMAIKRYV